MAEPRGTLQRIAGVASGRLPSARASDGSFAFVLGAAGARDLAARHDHVFIYQENVDLTDVHLLTASFDADPALVDRPLRERLSDRDPFGEIIALYRLDAWEEVVPNALWRTFDDVGAAGWAYYGDPMALLDRPWRPADASDGYLGPYPVLDQVAGGAGLQRSLFHPGLAAEWEALADPGGVLQLDLWVEQRDTDPLQDPTLWRPIVVHGIGVPGGGTGGGVCQWIVGFQPEAVGGGIAVYLQDDGGGEETYGPVAAGDGWSFGGGPFLLTVQIGSRGGTDETAIYINGVEKWRGTRTLLCPSRPPTEQPLFVGSACSDIGAPIIEPPAGSGTRIYEVRVLNVLRSARSVAWEARGRAREARWALEVGVDGIPCARRWLRPGRHAQALPDLRAYVGYVGGPAMVAYLLRLSTPDLNPWMSGSNGVYLE